MQTTPHNEAELWAAAAVTGGLTATELKAWHDHLVACPDCKELYNEELSLYKLMKITLQSECPDAGFERRIISKFRQTYPAPTGRPREFLRFFPVLVGAAACVALVAMAGIEWSGQNHRLAASGSANSPVAELRALPPAVVQTIGANSHGRTVSNVQRADDNGEVSYDIETTSGDGEQWGMTVAEDGTLQSIDLAPAEIPSGVQAVINVQVGRGTLEGVAKQFDDGETTYLAGIASPDGNERDFTFAHDGTLLSEEMDLDELPPGVRTAVNAEVGQGKLEGIDKNFDDGQITYEATMTTSAGQERDFSISGQGVLLSREVLPNEVPVAVQKAISQTLGQGKIVEIDRSFVTENQAAPYEVDGERDGRAIDFMLSPAGRFLGQQE
jgi:hypothetical protein